MMNYRKISILTFILLGISFVVNAQIDDEFWFVAPEVTDQHGDEPIFLRLTTFNTPASVKVSQPANPSFIPYNITIAANSTQSINMTARKFNLENKPADQVLNKGLLIESTTDITAYYEVANQFNPEIFPLKGRNGIGNEFFIPAQNSHYNFVGSAAIDFVATENNTTITVTVTDAIVGHAANTTFTVTLNRGETYSLEATNTASGSSLAGTYISSDKPIAVTISDDSIFQNGSYDLTGDQIVPVSVVGTEYIAVQGFSNAEKVYIVATEDNTDIHVDGSLNPVATINQGDLTSVSINGLSTYIRSTKPIYALHLSGHADEFGDALLPPIGCTGSDTIGFVRTSSDNFGLMLLTQAGNEGNFQLNGNANIIQASGFTAVPGTNGNWVAARYDLTISQAVLGNNSITNSSGLFHVGILNNLGFSSEYGFFSNYSSLHIGDDIAICKGDTLVLDAGTKKSSYLWSTGATTQTIDVTTSGTYWVEATIYNCPLKDTITVQVNSVDVDLGADTSICFYDDLFLDATSTNLSVSYEWQDSSTGSTFMATDEGLYHVALLDTLGCKSRDSIYIAYSPYAILGTDTSFVCDSLFYVLDPGVPSGTFTWQDGSTLPTFYVTQFGTYHVGIVDNDGCVSSDTVVVSFVTSPDVELGNDTLLCEGEVVVLDGSVVLQEEWLWQDTLLNNNQFYTVTEPGIYTVEAFDVHGCSDLDTIMVDYFLSRDVDLGNDTTVCQFETVLLNPMLPQGINYLWQDGSTDATFTVEDAGTYILTAQNQVNCLAYDTIVVNYIPLIENGTLPGDTAICVNDSLTLDVTQSYADYYLWSGGAASVGLGSKTEPTLQALVQGVYYVAIGNECGTYDHTIEVTYEDCTCIPFVPNGFTPNGDGQNDFFQFYAGCAMTNIRFSVYDRWGSLMFSSQDASETWDGTFDSVKAQAGVYTWRLEYTAENQLGEMETYLRSGDVALIR